jgi:predicted Zn-dependent peptidase
MFSKLPYRSLTLAALLAAALSAQTVDRTKPPQTPAIPSYKLPPIAESKLPNGLGVVLVEDARFPLVTLRLTFQAGSKFDPANAPGLAEAVATLLDEGTKTRTSRQISDEIDGIGGSIESSAGADSLTLSANALSDNLPRLLALVADVAMNSIFPQNEIDLYKQNRIQNLRQQHSDPGFLAEEKFASVVYGQTPYGHIAPTEASIAGVDGKELAAFRDAYLAPNNGTLLLIGKLPAKDDVMKLIAQQFAAWKEKPLPAAPKMDFPSPKRQIVLVDRPGSVQADIHIGRVAPTRLGPEFFPLSVGNSILGGGTNSRMFKDIREKEGFAYDAHSQYTTHRDSGDFQAVTEVRNEVLEPALKAVTDELDRMASAPVPTDELTGVKNYMSGLYLLRLETQEGVIGQLTTIKALGLPDSYLETYVTRVRSVEPQQIEAAAKKYMAPADAAIVVVGDAAKIGDTLKKFGTVTVAK